MPLCQDTILRFLVFATDTLANMRSTITLCAVLPAAIAYTFDPLRHLAGISPYFEPEDPQVDPALPQGCNVTRVGAGLLAVDITS
jgi:hypothetical protein